MYIDLGFVVFFFFFKQKTAYELRISDLSSDVCSSDLHAATARAAAWRQRVRSVDGRARVRGAVHRVLGIRARQRGHATDGGRSRQRGAVARGAERSEERRGGKEGVSTCRSRLSPVHEQKKLSITESRYNTNCTN